jgi:phosphoribosylformylglycinamidine cyclo-ligase
LLPHVSYLQPLDGLLDKGVIKGLAHITGGGLTDNIPRILPEGAAVQIHRDSWPIPPLFDLLRRLGNVSDSEMYRTFNMGVGMVIVCSANEAAGIEKHLRDRESSCYTIGNVVEGNREVVI